MFKCVGFLFIHRCLERVNYLDNSPCMHWKEGHVLFNDALNTFYLRLYGVGHMVKEHSERGNPHPHMG